MRYIPFEKMSKKAQREYLKAHRKEPIPALRVGKEVYEYKIKKERLY